MVTLMIQFIVTCVVTYYIAKTLIRIQDWWSKRKVKKHAECEVSRNQQEYMDMLRNNEIKKKINEGLWGDGAGRVKWISPEEMHEMYPDKDTEDIKKEFYTISTGWIPEANTLDHERALEKAVIKHELWLKWCKGKEGSCPDDDTLNRMAQMHMDKMYKLDIDRSAIQNASIRREGYGDTPPPSSGIINRIEEW